MTAATLNSESIARVNAAFEIPLLDRLKRFILPHQRLPLPVYITNAVKGIQGVAAKYSSLC